MMRESDDKRAMGRARTHSVSMDARERVVVTGAQELLSFNDMEVCVDTPLGVLAIEGEELHKMCISDRTIRAFVPRTEEQAQQQEMILWYLGRNREDVLTRENLAAHLTSSAMILNPRRDKALMVYHNIYQSWSWTGGHCDGDPDLIGVALREAGEETGLFKLTLWQPQPVGLDVIPVAAHYKSGRHVCADVDKRQVLCRRKARSRWRCFCAAAL